jgi:flagellar biosynthetic protein FliR
VDLFAPGAASVLILCGARLGGMLLIAPVFSARALPVRLRSALLVVLALLTAPVAYAVPGAVPTLTPATLLAETLIGFAIGFGAALFVGAIEAAGDLAAVQIGLSGATLMDPLSSGSAPVLGRFAQLFAIALLLAFDAHLVMIDALVASVRFLPVGAPVDVRAGLGAMLAAAAMLFSLGIRFAAPVVAAALIANVALAVLGRAAPQLNVLAVAFPVQIGVGLLAFAAAVPLMLPFFSGWEGAYDGVLTRFLAAFAGAR